MAEDNELNQDPNAGRNTAPTVEIPNLKKKEKERKKGGAIFGGGGPAAGAFEGAAGGAGRAAASAAASAAEGGAGAFEGAASQAAKGFFGRLFSPLMSIFSRMAETMAGRFALAALAAVVVGGVAMMIAALRAGTAPQAGASAPADLGAISSTIQVKTPRDQALDLAANSNNGTIKFGNAPKAGKSEKTDVTKDATKSDASEKSEASDQTEASANSGPECIEGNNCPHAQITGAKLSGALGGAMGGSKTAMFKGLDFGKGISSKLGGKLSGGKGGPATGKLAHSAVTGNSHFTMRNSRLSSRALGQLRSAGIKNGSVLSGGPTATEANSVAADSQFDGAVANGTPPSSPTDAAAGGSSNPGGSGSGMTGGTVTPVGSGYACSTTQSEAGGIEANGQCVVCPAGSTPDPTSGACNAITQSEGAPWMGMLGQAQSLVDKANQAIMMEAILSTLGTVLIAVGCAMLGSMNPVTVAIGIGLIILGALMLLMALMIFSQVRSMASQISALGNQISAGNSNYKAGGTAGQYGSAISAIAGQVSDGASYAMIPFVGLIMYLTGAIGNVQVPGGAGGITGAQGSQQGGAISTQNQNLLQNPENSTSSPGQGAGTDGSGNPTSTTPQ